MGPIIVDTVPTVEVLDLVAPECPADKFKSTVAGLNVTCYESSESESGWVMHITSTGLPDHQYLDPQHEVLEQDYDVEIPLAPTADKTRADTYQDPCDFQTTFETGSKPEKPQTPEFFPIVGFALNGVAFMSPLSINSVDPFYPPNAKDTEQLDGCIGHPQGQGIYHYHMMAPCVFGDDSLGQVPLVQAGDAKTLALAGFNPDDGLTIEGYAMDGFPIYGPYDDDGELHDGLDNCNGKFDDDGNYGYYQTTNFPYHVGCFGPGQYDTKTPSCSLNVDAEIEAELEAAFETFEDEDVIDAAIM